MDKPTLNRLYDYHYWANRRLWRSVLALTDQQFAQPLGDGQPSIRSQIVDMVANENLWVNYLWHGEVEFLQECHLPTRACIQKEWDALEEEIRDFIDELSPAELQRLIEPPFLNPRAALSVWEILLQVVNHATERRAQACFHLHSFGLPTPDHDFLGFLVEQRQSIPA